MADFALDAAGRAEVQALAARLRQRENALTAVELRSLGERESGGGAALPIWMDYMAQALRQVPVAEAPAAPAGVLREGGDWRYAEWSAGGWVQALRATGGAVYAAPAVPVEAAGMAAAVARPGEGQGAAAAAVPDGPATPSP